jgi:uncharacterized membrane protein YoaT (DUF817 family)
MELFKTATGSRIYLEPSLIRLGGVPLFSGFIYSCIGSYICRGLASVRFPLHRSSAVPLADSFKRGDLPQFLPRPLRLRPAARPVRRLRLLFCRATVWFRGWRVHRRMPLLLGLALVSLFIWLSENIGTFTRVWLYPSQSHGYGWAMVSFAKLGSWFLLLIISYTLVSLIDRPRMMVALDEVPLPQPEREAA